MSTTIYYFSGRGNALNAGRMIENKLAVMLVPNDDKKFFINGNCDGCGICRKGSLPGCTSVNNAEHASTGVPEKPCMGRTLRPKLTI